MFPKHHRLLLEHRLPPELADRLRADGHDVARADAHAGTEEEVQALLLAQADREERTLIVLDEGLAQHVPVAWVDRHPASGVVLLLAGTVDELAERTIRGAQSIPQMRWIKYKYGVLRPAVRKLHEQANDPPDEK